MNTNSQTVKQVKQDNPSFFVGEKKEKVGTSTEVTMSDIAKKLRSVYAQMQMKHVSRPVTAQSFVQESLKSYLDDISRAILAEYYIRRQKEKKLFEYLEQIKTLVQSLQKEKKNLEAAMVTRHMVRSKSLDSVVQKIADMVSEEEQERSLLQETVRETPNYSTRNSIKVDQKNFESALQQENKDCLPKDVAVPFSKEVEEFSGHSTRKEKNSDVQETYRCIEDDSSLALCMKPQKTFLSSLKKFFRYFLIIAFMTVITLCFYEFLKGVRFFNF